MSKQRHIQYSIHNYYGSNSYDYAITPTTRTNHHCSLSTHLYSPRGQRRAVLLSLSLPTFIVPESREGLSWRAGGTRGVVEEGSRHLHLHPSIPGRKRHLHRVMIHRKAVPCGADHKLHLSLSERTIVYGFCCFAFPMGLDYAV